MRRDSLLFVVVLVLVALVTFVVTNTFFKGYLESTATLAKELQSPQDSLYQAKLIHTTPYSYRVLFSSIVEGSYSLLFKTNNSQGYFNVYRVWSGVFYITSVVAFFNLLTVAGFSNKWSFAGALIFLFMPPMLLAFTVPVHTREDTLAYTILFTGLILLIKQKPWLFLVVSCIGVFCRETLLLLPFIYFLWSGDKALSRKLIITIVPCVVWLLLRFTLRGEPYDKLEGFHWNLKNSNQVIGFLFLSFNILWVTGFFGWMTMRRTPSRPDDPMFFFFRSSIPVLLLLLATTYFGGIFNEIRLLYLFAPWSIALTIYFLMSNSSKILEVLKRWYYLAFIAVGLIIIVVVLSLDMLPGAESFHGKYIVPYRVWMVSALLFTLSTAIVTPAFTLAFINKKDDA